MNVSIPTWSVVTTADEPVQVLVGFVAHHVALGAARVVVHLDRPAPETFATLATIPGCLPVQCDEAYWAGFGAGRPDNLHRRQRLNASRWYWLGETDWVAHFDADEFLQPDGKFAEELAAIPPDIASLQIPNGERAWSADQPAATIFDGVLRLHGGGRKRREARLFGAAAPFTSWGFAGYRLWKSVTRTKLGVSLGIHFPRQKDRHSSPKIPVQSSARSILVHFDGLTPLHWATKLFRYDQMGMYGAGLRRDDQRHAQVSYILENAGKVSAIRELHDLIKVVRPQQFAPLTSGGQLTALTIRPSEAAKKYFPDLDLSPSAFDRELVRSRPEFASKFQDWAALSSAAPSANT